MLSSPALPGFDDLTVFRSLFAAYPDALLLVDSQGFIVLALNDSDPGQLKFREIGNPWVSPDVQRRHDRGTWVYSVESQRWSQQGTLNLAPSGKYRVVPGTLNGVPPRLEAESNWREQIRLEDR